MEIKYAHGCGVKEENLTYESVHYIFKNITDTINKKLEESEHNIKINFRSKKGLTRNPDTGLSIDNRPLEFDLSFMLNVEVNDA